MSGLRRFKPYPAYKDSGVEWLGEIPAHWEVKKWRYCCHVTEGQVAPEEEWFRDRILIAPNHIESGTGRILYTETADEQGAISGKYLVAPGDIIYSKIRPALNKVCIAAGHWLCSADMYPVAVTEKRLQARFLLYFILSEPFVRLMVDESMRVAMPKVNRDKLATCPIIIADPDEQCAIAAFLDRETARIDALVAKKERLIELLQEKRTALITRAVTKGLDPTVPMKDSGVEWLGEIPAHWEVQALSRILLRITYGFTNPMPVADVGPYMLTALDIGDGEISFEDARRTTEEAFERLLTDKSRPRAGDLLVTKDGTLGRVAVAGGERMCINQSVALLRLDPAVDVGFTQHTLRAAPYQERMSFEAGGTAIKHIYVSRLARMSIALPAKEEQRAIAAFLDRETAQLDALIAKVRDAIDRLKEMRTALISAAVTGKIDVRAA